MEKIRFENLIDQVATKASLERWEPLYNRQLDFFYWKKPRLSKDTRLVKVSHEAHLYLTPTGAIEGIMVEYLTGNFIAHNAECKPLRKTLRKKVSAHEYTVDRKDRETTQVFEKFAITLRADIYRDAIRSRKSSKDLEALLAAYSEK